MKCPICKKKYDNEKNLFYHLETDHNDILNNMSGKQYMFNIRNKKNHGSCTICKKETKWNEASGHYERFCSDNCKKIYRKQFEKRMINEYGKVCLLDDADRQKLMLSKRKISGTYQWNHTKGSTSYTGSYELEFLKFLDVYLEWSPTDIMSPCPHSFEYYDNENKKHFYIPDFYLPSINTIVEIKDGGNNPNNHPKIQEVDKYKEKLKDDLMKNNKVFNYIKVTNKNHLSFILFLADLKNYNNIDKNPLIIINENSIMNIDYNNENNILNEGVTVKAVKRNDYKKNGITRNINYYINFLNNNFTEKKILLIQKEFKNYNKDRYDTDILSNTLTLYEAKMIFEEIKKHPQLYSKVKDHEPYYQKYKNLITELNKKAFQLDKTYHKGVVYKDAKDDLDVQIDRIKRLSIQQNKVLKEASDSYLTLIKERMKQYKGDND